MNNSIPQKYCGGCKQYYPPTTEYFHRNKRTKSGLGTWCKVCANAARKQHVIDHPEIKQAYKERNRDRIRRQDREYYATHPKRQESQRKRTTDRRNKDIEADRKRSRDYGRAHIKETVERNKEWAKKNPERYKQIMANRYARDKNAEGSYTEEDLNTIYEELSGRCAYCGINIYWSVFRDVHIDHIKPLSKGGTNWPDNITLACKNCNCSKSSKTLEDWLLSRGW